MNRIMKLSVGALAMVSAGAGSVAMATAGTAGAAAPRQARQWQAGAAGAAAKAVAQAPMCSVSTHNYSLPKAPTTYKAGTAGSVTVTRVNSGTIKVAGVHHSTGWHAFVDSSSGSSVDVYFRSGSRTIKFEAEINDSGGLTVRVTSC